MIGVSSPLAHISPAEAYVALQFCLGDARGSGGLVGISELVAIQMAQLIII